MLGRNHDRLLSIDDTTDVAFQKVGISVSGERGIHLFPPKIFTVSLGLYLLQSQAGVQISRDSINAFNDRKKDVKIEGCEQSRPRKSDQPEDAFFSRNSRPNGIRLNC